MKPNLESLARVDYSFLETLRGISRPGEPDVAVTIVTIFLKNAPGILESISKAIGDNQASKAAALAHKLKSSTSNVGAKKLTQLLNDFEESSDISEQQRIFTLAREEYQQVAESLRSFK